MTARPPARLRAPRLPTLSLVHIRQLQLRYDPHADRLLWQIDAVDAAPTRIWLTRRLLARAGPALHAAIERSDAATQVAAGVTVHPLATPMLAEAGRMRPLPNATFGQGPAPRTEDLSEGAAGDPTAGAGTSSAATTAPVMADPRATDTTQPLLPAEVDISPGLQGRGLRLRLRDADGRGIVLQMNPEMATAFSRLLARALADADWALAGPSGAALSPQPVVAPHQLN